MVLTRSPTSLRPPLLHQRPAALAMGRPATSGAPTSLQPAPANHLQTARNRDLVSTHYTIIFRHTYIYIHIHIHTYMHKYIHTYTHTHIHTYIHTYIHTRHGVLYAERVADRLRRLTRGIMVWSSIPDALVRCKSLGQALNPQCLWSPSSNGYLVHRSRVASTVAASFPRQGER